MIGFFKWLFSSGKPRQPRLFREKAHWADRIEIHAKDNVIKPADAEHTYRFTGNHEPSPEVGDLIVTRNYGNRFHLFEVTSVDPPKGDPRDWCAGDLRLVSWERESYVPRQ